MAFPRQGLRSGTGPCLSEGTVLMSLSGKGQKEELSLVRGGEWQVGAAFLMLPHPPSFLLSLLSLRLRDCQVGGRERERERASEQFGTGLDFQSNIYNALFISLPLEKRSGFWQNSMSGSRRNKTRLPAVRATACFLRNRPSGGSRVSLRAHGPGPLFCVLGS